MVLTNSKLLTAATEFFVLLGLMKSKLCENPLNKFTQFGETFSIF